MKTNHWWVSFARFFYDVGTDAYWLSRGLERGPAGSWRLTDAYKHPRVGQ